MSVYLGEFDDWDDVADAFDLVNTVEPADVFAAYAEEYYEGSALVIVRKPNDLFDVVEGSHCSCYGLEGQFDPTVDMPRAAVVAMLKDADDYDSWGGYGPQALEWLGES